MGIKWLAVRESPCNEGILVAKSLQEGSRRGLNAPACRVRYGAGSPRRADTCFVERSFRSTTAVLLAVTRPAFDFMDACLFFSRPPK